MACFFSPKILMSCGVLWLTLFGGIKSEERENSLSACEIEKLLKPILSPPEERTIQAQALRQRLINLLRQGFEEQLDNGSEEKRSLSSLARSNDLPMKRNLQALARAGYLNAPTDDDDENNDSYLKRNIQSLVRSRQLPSEEMRNEESKRSIAALARNGELHNTRRELEELLDELYEKRNIGSLARDFNFPGYGKRFLGSLAKSGDLRFDGGKRNLASVMRSGKRSLASLVKNNDLPSGSAYDEFKRNIAALARDGGKFVGKRNVAALLRQDNYLNEKHQQNESEDENQTEKPDDDSDEIEAAKRNIASVKAGYKPRRKRSISYVDMVKGARDKREANFYDYPNEEYPQPVYQNQNNMDYEELMNAINGIYPNTEKRFLGSVARSGWPSSLVKYRGPDKRHIGSLARLGWLPSFRTARRFNRSGRSTNYEECGVCRETTSDGQAEDDAYSESPEKEDKRFLLIPAVDNILLRKFPMRPRTH